jgi:glycosyltransferase involved in cell wall biosynthesis
MSPARRLGVAWRVLRAEGPAAFRDRAVDRLAEASRRRSYTPAPAGWHPEDPIPVLLVSATPPAPWLGGVPSQLRTRLEAEVRGRSVALLYPLGGRWRLEVHQGAERRFLELPGSLLSPVTLEDAAFEDAVRAAAACVGARAVQAEGLAGLPPVSLLRLAREGLALVLSLHDFAAFCPRPNLVEEPPRQFCRYSRDLGRCGRCLAADWPVGSGFQEARRKVNADLLAAAAAVIFSSDVLRRTHDELFPGLATERWRVLEPAIASTAALPRRAPEEEAARSTLRHVAFVGSVQPHKGALVFAEAVRRLSREPAGEQLRWSAYGGGDVEILRNLRRLGVRTRGYYRSGSLPPLLQRDGVDLALLLSIWPETHSLVLSECVVAGVPVVAFALGAPAERVPHLGAGRLVSLEDGVDGIVAAIRDSLRDGMPEVPAEAARLLTDPVSAAAGHLALYRELGLAD